MNELKEAALDYARKGFPVFPCNGKVPYTQRGCKDATTDLATIESWWNLHPNANIGMATGAASGIMVVDIDRKDNGFESAEKLNQEHNLDHNAGAITGSGGLHLLFKHQEGIRNRQGFLPGIDVRGEGGYIIVAPSIHPDTKVPYTWGSSDWAEQIKPLPESLAKILLTPEAKENLQPRSMSGAVAQAGGRHKYLMQVVGSMRRRGLSDEAILAAINEENDVACDPPLPAKDLERMIETTRNYPVEAPIDLNYGDDDDQRLYVSEESSGRLVKASSLTSNMVTYLKDKSKVKGIPTGFDGLDKMLGGGRRQGEVTCWHAEAKTGKNTLWHYLMYIWLEMGIPMAYASRELSPAEEVLPNLLSVATGQNVWLAEVGDYSSIVDKWPLYFSDGYGYFPQDQIREWVEHGVEAGIKSFWFDHLHYMLEDPEDHKAASRLIKDLKSLAKVKDISIDIIIQPNKLMDGQKLSLNSIKGGAAMGQAIDNLLILERVRDQRHVSRLTLEVARSKLCVPGSIYLQFDPDSTRFTETEPKKDDPTPQDVQLISDDIPVADRKFAIQTKFKTLI